MSRIAKLLASLIVVLNLWNPMNSPAQAQSKSQYGIVIHGGAGGEPDKWTDEYKAKRTAGLKVALDTGVSLLKEGKSALDVVEQVVRVLEDDPIFNAGRGCVLNEAGDHELDAAIMDGASRACGAVASVRKIKNPISLARRVMTDTKHVLLIGNGADEFGLSLKLEQAGPSISGLPNRSRRGKNGRRRSRIKHFIAPKLKLTKMSSYTSGPWLRRSRYQG